MSETVVEDSEQRGPASVPASLALAEFFGEEWPAVRERLIGLGVDVETPLALLPWEDVEPVLEQELVPGLEDFDEELAARIGWAVPMNNAFLETAFDHFDSLSEEQLVELETRVAELNAEIEEVARSLHVLELQAVQRAWDSGSYEKSPLTTMALDPKSQSGCAVARSAGHGGWTVLVCLQESDVAERRPLVQRMTELSQQRSWRTRTFLDSLED